MQECWDQYTSNAPNYTYFVPTCLHSHYLEDASAVWGKPEHTAHCAGLCHGTQNMNSNRISDCPLSVRAATMPTHAWMGLATCSCLPTMGGWFRVRVWIREQPKEDQRQY